MSVAVVASKNRAKVEGVRRALRLLGVDEVIGVDVPRFVPPQPIGLRDTLYGALMRAKYAYDTYKGEYNVGIEAGLIPFPSPTGFIDVQIAIVIDSNKYVSLGISPGFSLPRDITISLLETGQELADLAEKYSGIEDVRSSIGVIGWLSNGRVTRLELSYYATLMAILPWLKKELYRDSLLSLEEFRKIADKQIF